MTKIVDIAKKVYSGGTPDTKKKEYWNGNIKWLSSGETRSNFVYNTDKKITELGVSNSSTKLAKKSSIVMACAGQGFTRGQTSYLMDDMYINQSVICIEPDEEKVDGLFLYYYFKNSYQMLRNLSDDHSSRGSITTAMIKNLEVDFPSLVNQKKISTFLYGLDRKIELNNQINDNLFNLININYKRYLNEVIKSDKADEISVKDIFDFESGVEPGSKNYLEKEDKDTIKFYRVGDMDSDCKTFIKKDLANCKFINEDDIVVSFDATIGRIGYGLNGSFSTGMKKINVNNKYKNIIDNSVAFAYFINPDTQNKILENAKGTTILHAGSAINFLNFKYNEELLRKYGKIISIFFQKMKQIKKENENLSNLRDTLLPKLMNGEIDLENIEI